MSINVYLFFGIWYGIFLAVPILFAISVKYDYILRRIMSVFLAFYVVLTLLLTILTVQFNVDMIDISFDFSGEWMSKEFSFDLFPSNFEDFIINILMLVPFGGFIYCLSKKRGDKRILNAIYLGLLFSIVIELLQFFMPISRSPQLSDILLNTISSLIGAVIFMFLTLLRNEIYKPSVRKKHKVKAVKKTQSIENKTTEVKSESKVSEDKPVEEAVGVDIEY